MIIYNNEGKACFFTRSKVDKILLFYLLYFILFKNTIKNKHNSNFRWTCLLRTRARPTWWLATVILLLVIMPLNYYYYLF